MTVVGAHSSSGLTVDNTTPTQAAGARTVYKVAFTTSSTGGLSEAANSRIDLSFATGTSLANWTGGTVTVAGTSVGACTRLTDPHAQCWLYSGRTIAPNTAVLITFEGVANPIDNGTLSLSTTSDPTAQTKAVGVVSAQQVGATSLAVSSHTASATTRYVLRFTTSSTGGFSEQANSRIPITFATGTSLTSWTGGVVHDQTAGTDVGACTRLTGPSIECWLYSGRTVAADHVVRITVEHVTNPATAGPYQVKVATTSDPAQVTSPNSTVGEPLPPETTIDSDNVQAAVATFAFSASEPGSPFECRIDDAPFAACTSPYTTPELPAGTHTFQVRALDAAGNPDPSPSARTFTVAGGQPPVETATPVPTTSPTPTPVPTVTATPTPTPEPVATFKTGRRGQHGERHDPGLRQARRELPDAARRRRDPGRRDRRRAQGRRRDQPSAPTARSRRRSSTTASSRSRSPPRSPTLTLTEPLASCPKQEEGRARAAKKPKTRKLWGDGKGKFRTRGQYSAATVRGTKWLVQDSCAGTLTRVTQGVVSVRDEVKKKTLTLRAGKRYLAKPR